MTTTHVGTLTVTSDDFTDGGTLGDAQIYNGNGLNGGNTSPALAWSGAPPATKSFAIAMHDPDAPTTVGFTHWTMIDIPPDVTSLKAGAGAKHHNPRGTTLGLNDFSDDEYMGPCPPPGPPHHYHITVYALDLDEVGAGPKFTYPKLRFIIRDHILASGTITGLFGLPA